MRNSGLQALLHDLGKEYQVHRIIQLDQESGTVRIPEDTIIWSARFEYLATGANRLLTELPIS